MSCVSCVSCDDDGLDGPGPGDPTFCQKTIENVRALLARESAKEDPIPVFGICLGNQIMGLAAGAKTYKLKFGNR